MPEGARKRLTGDRKERDSALVELLIALADRGYPVGRGRSPLSRLQQEGRAARAGDPLRPVVPVDAYRPRQRNA
jgi:hypothetical protein